MGRERVLVSLIIFLSQRGERKLSPRFVRFSRWGLRETPEGQFFGAKFCKKCFPKILKSICVFA